MIIVILIGIDREFTTPAKPTSPLHIPVNTGDNTEIGPKTNIIKTCFISIENGSK